MATITFEHTGIGGRTVPGSSLVFGLGPRAPLAFMPLGPGPDVNATAAGVRQIIFEGDAVRPVTRIWYATVGDTAANVLQIKSNGTAVNLTSLASANLRAESCSTGTLKINKTFTSSDVTDATAGEITWVPQSTDVDTAGLYWAQIALTYSDGSRETVPNNGKVYFHIEAAIS